MRTMWRTVLALLLIAGVIAYLGLDRLLKRAVETQSTDSLKLTTMLQRAHLSVFGGKLHLNRLQIASPRGFSAPQMLELGDVDLAVRYGELRKDPIHVQSLRIDKPRLIIEQSNGALNFKKAVDGMPPHGSSQKPVKLVIDELEMRDAQVVIHPGLPGLREEINVLVPSIALKNVGSGSGSQNGAAIKDIAMVVIAALAKSAAESGDLPPEVKGILQLNAGQIAAAIPGELGNSLSKVASDPQGLAKDPGKELEGEASGILGGKKDSAQQAPAGRSGAPAKR